MYLFLSTKKVPSQSWLSLHLTRTISQSQRLTHENMLPGKINKPNKFCFCETCPKFPINKPLKRTNDERGAQSSPNSNLQTKTAIDPWICAVFNNKILVVSRPFCWHRDDADRRPVKSWFRWTPDSDSDSENFIQPK